MSDQSQQDNPQLCQGCVYYPPNLPRAYYTDDEWALLEGKTCSYDATPGDGMCEAMRKTSCSLVSLEERDTD